MYEFTDSPVRADLPDERKLEPVFFTDMTPSAEGYRNLTEFSGCGMSGCNADIYRLLSLTRTSTGSSSLTPPFPTGTSSGSSWNAWTAFSGEIPAAMTWEDTGRHARQGGAYPENGFRRKGHRTLNGS